MYIECADIKRKIYLNNLLISSKCSESFFVTNNLYCFNVLHSFIFMHKKKLTFNGNKLFFDEKHLKNIFASSLRSLPQIVIVSVT
jgi:hypothetical protein